METSATSGRGRAMRARPKIDSSNPCPNSMQTTAMPSTSAKELKLMPAANQKRSFSAGKVFRTSSNVAHQVARRVEGRVERGDHHEIVELRHVRGRDHVAVDAKAAADAGQEEGRRPADGPGHRAEGEEGGEGALRPALDRGVAAEDRQAVGREAGDQHADILDVRVLAELAQAPRQRDARQVGGDGETGEVDLPTGKVEEVRVPTIAHDDVRYLQIINRAGETKH